MRVFTRSKLAKENYRKVFCKWKIKRGGKLDVLTSDVI